MTFQTFVFYLLSLILLFAGVRVITTRNPVHAALFLVLSFVTAAGLWLLLEAEFLAIVLVLVYVGAVTVLFLFVVMTLDINLDRLREGFWRYLPLGAAIGVMMVIEMTLVLGGEYFAAAPSPPAQAAGYSNTKELGRLIYTDYVYPFEIAAVVLLVAIISAISLTLRPRKRSKYQDPAEQVKVRPQERMRIVSMPVEKELEGEGVKGEG